MDNKKSPRSPKQFTENSYNVINYVNRLKLWFLTEDFRNFVKNCILELLYHDDSGEIEETIKEKTASPMGYTRRHFDICSQKRRSYTGELVICRESRHYSM